MSLAHGANDVSNAVGPFSAIYGIYANGKVDATASVPLWVLCLGGSGIVVGLATYGVNIMRLLGEKLAVITPARGFSAELSTALVVSFATIYGIPISSTHCITGAVIGISIMDVGIAHVRWRMIARMYVG
uniref:Phosphate-repressible phosphate permease n=1 Tax=Lygus hesperus TaxID=30085 RepID=A0A0A9YWL0_LYGHE